MIRPKKGNYAFIDSQNLNVSVQKYGWKMDWKKFRQFPQRRGRKLDRPIRFSSKRCGTRGIGS